VIRTESKPRNMVRKRAFQSGVPLLSSLGVTYSNLLQMSFFIPFCLSFAFYSIHIFRSRLEGVSFYGNLLLFLDKSYRFDWILWIPTFTELGWQAKLKTLVLAALLKLLIGFLSYALIKDYLDSGVQLHGWTVERKLTTETLDVSCSQTTAQYKLTE
jgi:hypothetical protein